MLLVLALFPGGAAGQSTTGSISGQITDQSGAALSGVDIAVVQAGTGLERRQVSDATGYYRVLNLNPGQYTVTAELPGFIVPPVENLVVTVSRDVRVDIEMRVSSIEIQEIVGGQTSRLDLGRDDGWRRRHDRQIAELPLNGRSFMQLASLQPGVVVSRGTGRGLHRRLRPDAALDRRRAARADRLPDGRHQHRRHLRQGAVERGGRAARRRHGAGVQRADARLQRRVRPRRRRHHQRGHQVGHQPVPRQRLRVPPQQRARRAQHLRRGGDRPAFRRNQFGGTLGGPILQEPAVLLRRLRGPARRAIDHALRAAAQRARAPGPACPTPPACSRTSACIPPCGRTSTCCFPRPPARTSATARPNWRTPTWTRPTRTSGSARSTGRLGSNDSLLFRVVARHAPTRSTSQEHPLFVESAATDTRYFTGQHQHLFSANVLNVLRVAANRTYRDNDLLPTVDIPRRCTSPRIRTGAPSR